MGASFRHPRGAPGEISPLQRPVRAPAHDRGSGAVARCGNARRRPARTRTVTKPREAPAGLGIPWDVVLCCLRGVGIAASLAVMVAGCGDPVAPLSTAAPGVIFTFPVDQQLDVPVGSRIVLTFSDPIAATALGPCTGSGAQITGALCLVGPEGPVAATAEVSPDGATVSWSGAGLVDGTTYAVYARPALLPAATTLPATGPLLSFTTRSTRPRAAAPTLIAIDGGAPASAGDPATRRRPLVETSTIRLTFSEPLDPRTVVMGSGAIELLAGTTQVPVTLVHEGIHVAIDPARDLVAGTPYVLRLGGRLLDLGGQPVTTTTTTLTPQASLGPGATAQRLRTRGPADPGPATSRTGSARNVIVFDKPLIGREESTLAPSALAAELGDPRALGGPIAFVIRRGQRMSASGLEVALGGEIPLGLSTGAIEIEILTDSGGRIFRNAYQPAEQVPENARAPLHADLTLDLAVYARDPRGNAVLTQTVLGIQAAGIVTATDGVLAIEAVASMDLDLLGITKAPTNFVLELITDPAATLSTDTSPPEVTATSPANGSAIHAVDAGVTVIFSEPVDLDRARAGIRLENIAGGVVPAVLESQGAAIVIRPLTSLAYNSTYRVVMAGITDLAGNELQATTGLQFNTPRLVGTGSPPTAVAIHPGVPCALSGGGGGIPGRCAGGAGGDDVYQPFTLPANQPVVATFSQPMTASSFTLGTACGTGSVRVEITDGAGGCLSAVPGTLLVHDRAVTFVPDLPWISDTRYRLTLVSGGNDSCDGGEICGVGGVASFDPLNGTEGGDGGGGNLVIPFLGAPASAATFMVTETTPYSDINGSGYLDGGESTYDENRAAMRIVDTTGSISNARFEGTDCLPGTSETEACIYLQGALPVAMGELSTDCPLPDGTRAPRCIPAMLTPQAMYATSVSMSATVGISISTDTGTAVMRVREPAAGPVIGHVIDRGGVPTLIAQLELYMDAPDMSVTLSDHDLHSKPLAVTLEGPLTFLPDGRIAITVSNVADVPVEVTIDAPLGIGGTVQIILPAGEMHLQLLSPLVRGGAL